jgi:hypothetical protein
MPLRNAKAQETDKEDVTLRRRRYTQQLGVSREAAPPQDNEPKAPNPEGVVQTAVRMKFVL